MKIWVKLLIGAVLGTAIGIVVPADVAAINDIFGGLVAFTVGFGRYALLPLLAISVPIAVSELFEDAKLVRTTAFTVLFSLLAVCVAALLGTTAAVALNPPRIPLIAEAARLPNTPSVSDLLLGIFPANAFSALFSSGDYLFPLVVAAFALGLAFTYDKTATKPVVTFFDSMSRIVYQINSFFVEILAVLMIPLAAAMVVRQRTSQAAPVYGSLLLSVAIETLVAAFVMLPLALYFLGGRKNPFPKLYALLGPSLAAFVGGDALFPAGALLKHTKESLGVRRRSGSVSLPLAFVFGRAGTALITSTAFIVVLASYSNIGLTPSAVLWVMLIVPPVMILVSAAPGAGPATAVMTLCAIYGRGFESGYLLLVPVAAPLAACAITLDTLVAGTIAHIVAKREGYIVERDMRHFV